MTEHWIVDNTPSQKWPLYTRGNVGEVFPEVVYPLTWELVGHEAERGWRDSYTGLGLTTAADFPPGDDWTILGIFGGYCYLNASYIRMMGVRTPGSSVEAIDAQFFGESEAPAYRARKGDKNALSTAKLAKSVLDVLRTNDLPELATDQRSVEGFLDGRPTGDDVSNNRMWGYLLGYAPLFRHLFARHITITFQAIVASGLVADICADKLNAPWEAVSMLGGIGDIESARPAAAMWALSRTDGEEFTAGLAGFLAEFGFRGPNEWELASDTWESRPELVTTAIERMRSSADDHDPAHQQRYMQERRQEAIARSRARLGRADRFVFDKALSAATVLSQGRERSKTTVIRAHNGARRVQRELAGRAVAKGGTTDLASTCLLTVDEFLEYLDNPEPFLGVIEERRARKADLDAKVPPFVFEGHPPAPDTWAAKGAGAEPMGVGDEIVGIGGCPGQARGRARIVTDPGDPGNLGPGDVLVAPLTDPSWTPLFTAAEAVVVDVGAVMSHAVIVSRELGIPCAVSVTDATHRIPEGALIEVDGATGRVTVLEVP